MSILTSGWLPLFLLVTAVAAEAQAGRTALGEESRFTVGARVETWRVEGDITGSDVSPAVPIDVESGVTLFAQHSAGFITGDYSYHGIRETVIRHETKLGLSEGGPVLH